MSIQEDLLARIRVTGITDEDYKHAEEYMKMIDIVSPLFFQDFYIYDYNKMKMYYFNSNKYGLQHVNSLENEENNFNTMYNNMLKEQQQCLLSNIAKSQDLAKSIPPNERQDFIFLYDFNIQINGKKERVCYRYKILQAAPDGRIWLELGVQSLSTFKGPDCLTALNLTKHEIWTIDELTGRWNKTTMPLLSDKEKEILNMSAQGLMIKEIAERLFRTESTIETHRKAIFKKLGVTNMIEAIGYALNHQLI